MNTILEKLNVIPKETNHIRIREFYKPFQQLEQLQKIVDMIAVCESRINYEVNFCEKFYGKNYNGNIQGSESNSKYIIHQKAIIKRLKRYYNSKVEQLTKY